MITEDYCSYEVAKLLKEKGFDEVCTRVYIEIEGRWGNYPYQPTTNSQIKEVIGIMCPTHQMAMKWLREKDILISVVSALGIYEEHIEGYVACVDTMTDNVLRCKQEILRDTYEEAVEAAIKYSLENLI